MEHVQADYAALVETENKETVSYFLAKSTNERATNAKPKIMIIPAQNTNHSLGIVMFTR